MSTRDQLLAELRNHPPAAPVPVDELAERLGCSPADVLAAGHALERREPGDHELVAVIKRTSDDGAEEIYLALSGLPLNDEPETR